MGHHYYLSYYLPKQSRLTAPVNFTTDHFPAFQEALAKCDKYGYEVLGAYIIGDREIIDISSEVQS